MTAIALKTLLYRKQILVSLVAVLFAACATTESNLTMDKWTKFIKDTKLENQKYHGIAIRNDFLKNVFAEGKDINSEFVFLASMHRINVPYWFATNNETQIKIGQGCMEYYKKPCTTVWEWSPKESKWIKQIDALDKIKKEHLKELAEKDRQLKIARENAQIAAEKQKADFQRKEIERRQNTCISFGFTLGNELMAKCVFELFKLEQAALQNDRLIRNMNDNAAAQRVVAEQQLKEQEFNNGMMLLQQSQQILNNTYGTPKIKCKHNNILNTTTCY